MSSTATTTQAAIHSAKNRPMLVIGRKPSTVSGSSSEATTAIASAQRRRANRSGSCACFQRAIGPMPIRNSAGAIIGTNTDSK